MTESDELLYDVLYRTLLSIPTAKALVEEGLTPAEMTELLRLHAEDVYEAYHDLSVAFQSLNFIAADFQLRLKAEDIWRQQLEVFRSRLKPHAEDFLKTAQAHGIDVKEEIENLLNY